MFTEAKSPGSLDCSLTRSFLATLLQASLVTDVLLILNVPLVHNILYVFHMDKFGLSVRIEETRGRKSP